MSSPASPLSLLRPALLPPPARYRLMARSPGSVAILATAPHDKRRKETHRFTIASTRGPLQLTIPVAKPEHRLRATEADILLSGHSPWWQTVMTALESAYGRTPYFEFYADDFAALLHPGRVGTPLVTLLSDLDALVCRLIGVQPPEYLRELPGGATLQPEPLWEPAPYWQVRAHSLGFIPGMSIADMLFSLGPETLPLLLR